MNINQQVLEHLNSAVHAANDYASNAGHRGDRGAQDVLNIVQQLHKAILVLAGDVARIDDEQKSPPPAVD
jgi:hypothetical protein